VLGVVVLVAVVAVAAFVLRGDDASDSGPQFEASTSVDLTAGEAKVESVGAPVEFPAELRDQLLSSIGTYVDDAIVKPLRAGKADGAALTALFDQAAVARLAGPDRAILLDEGLPKAVGKIRITTPPVALTGLAAADGKVLLATASLDLQVSARARKGVIDIHRAGTLVFALDLTGAWKIAGWTLTVERAGPGVTTTTTAAPTPTTLAAP
jgi:hypothetical protein